MPRRKSKSEAVKKAQARAAALESIGASLDLGGGLTLDSYKAAIAAAQNKLDTYNTILSTADKALNELNQSNKELNDLSERMLAGVGARFGKDSSEYEMAGGTRKSERKRPAHKARVTPESA